MDTSNFIVTTGHKPTDRLAAKAKALAEEFGTRFAPRQNDSLPVLRAKYNAESILLVTRKGLAANTREGELFFHLNMAHLRIKTLKAGKPDNMAEAMRLQPGMSVLDCTLGLASDAIVSSLIVGGEGKVTGLEINPLIALIVRDGLRTFEAQCPEIKAALERIEVVRADYRDYLAAAKSRSFDVVYIDPMFRRPIRRSVHLQPLRALADHGEIEKSALAEAARVAKRRVVVKEANASPEFARLGVDYVMGGKYSSIQYGVIETNEAQK